MSAADRAGTTIALGTARPMRTITIRFDESEAWLVAEALAKYQPDAPADRIKVKQMVDLFDEELGGGRKGLIYLTPETG